MSHYAIISDLHFHNWSAFSTIGASGVNMRLAALTNEVGRAVRALKELGGDTLFIAGDVFHVRGNVSPSVLNPVLEVFKFMIDNGLKIVILSGNHDLEGKSASRLGSAITALESVGCITVSDKPAVHTVRSSSPSASRIDVGLIPWQEDLDELRKLMVEMKGKCKDLIIHAPVNKVIKGLPDTGLDPEWIESLGFDNVFAGHHHNHKKFGDSVYSIGAIAHHSWVDVGSQPGFLLVSLANGHVTFKASRCPRFVELDDSMGEVDMRLEADGNYVKARIGTADASVVADMRQLLFDAGAKGVVIVADPASKSGATRAASGVVSGQSTDQSIVSYIDGGTFTRKEDLKAACLKIMEEVRSVA